MCVCVRACVFACVRAWVRPTTPAPMARTNMHKGDNTALYWAAKATQDLTNQAWGDVVPEIRQHMGLNRRKNKKHNFAGIRRARRMYKKQANHTIKVGAWNTRGMGATHGKTDPYLKMKHMATLWERRGWDAALLSDVRFGISGTVEVNGGSQKWVIVYRGKVAIALSEKLANLWLDSGNTANIDGKGAHCRAMMLNMPVKGKKRDCPNVSICPQLNRHRRGNRRRLRIPLVCARKKKKQIPSHNQRRLQWRSKKSCPR